MSQWVNHRQNTVEYIYFLINNHFKKTKTLCIWKFNVSIKSFFFHFFLLHIVTKSSVQREYFSYLILLLYHELCYWKQNTIGDSYFNLYLNT